MIFADKNEKPPAKQKQKLGDDEWQKKKLILRMILLFGYSAVNKTTTNTDHKGPLRPLAERDSVAPPTSTIFAN